MTVTAPSNLANHGVLGPPRHRTVRYGPELRVLIVGGGVAGLTLAALLEQRGFTPLVVESVKEHTDEGHSIGLWPAGSRILKGLKLFTKLCDVGAECSRYIIANEGGDTLHSFSLAPLTKRYGPLIELSRLQLLELLRSQVDPQHVRFGVTVRQIAETPDGVVAEFDDGRVDVFDLVVGCDGIRSIVRQLTFGDVPMDYSGVAGWTFWLPPDFVPPPEDRRVLGRRQVRRHVSGAQAILRGRRHALPTRYTGSRRDPRRTRADGVGRIRRDRPMGRARASRAGPHDSGRVQRHPHERVDAWSRRTHRRCGARHLPTAGMGASMAMESAAVLAEELCRTDSKYVSACLQQYESRRRARVDRIQARARRLARVMFAGNGLVTRIRDHAMRIMVDEPLLDTVDEVMAERI